MDPTHCPNCNSTQTFSRQREFRVIPGTCGGREIRIFIRCNKCHWSHDLYVGTEEGYRDRKRLGELRVGQAKGVPVERSIATLVTKMRADLDGLVAHPPGSVEVLPGRLSSGGGPRS